jgi:hypothetical protein
MSIVYYQFHALITLHFLYVEQNKTLRRLFLSAVLQVNPSIIRQWLRSGDLEKLESVVLEGQGHKLVGEYSPDPNVRAYLKTIPALMVSIKRRRGSTSSQTSATVGLENNSQHHSDCKANMADSVRVVNGLEFGRQVPVDIRTCMFSLRLVTKQYKPKFCTNTTNKITSRSTAISETSIFVQLPADVYEIPIRKSLC